MYQPVKILSVGGSIVIPKTGFDIAFLQSFRQLILDEVASGSRFILVIGGGATCRAYQNAAKEVIAMTKDDLDWIGIYTTQFNAKFVHTLFKGHVTEEFLFNPHEKIDLTHAISIGAGYEPGHSTDMDAVILAETYGASEILNLSNIAYAYTKDPNKFADAEKIEHMDWQTFRDEVVGHDWDPGKSAPFDPIASKRAQELGLKVAILDGTNIDTVRKAVRGEAFDGTRIG